MSPGSAVLVNSVDIALGGRMILRDVSLDVERGEFVAVLGPNGAGKSTLMRALLGLVAVRSGSIEVLGRSPALARSRTGYLPQRRSFDHSLRVRGIDLVRLGLDGARWGIPLPLTSTARDRRRDEQALVREVLELVGASEYANRPLNSLSGGEQQRLLIAQALVTRPQLLILDEPLDSLDLPNQGTVSALLSRISKGQGVAVLLVAHDINPLLGYVDRVAYLVNGRAMTGPTDQVISSETLSALYGAPVEVLQTGDGRLVVVGQPEAPHYHGHRHDEP